MSSICLIEHIWCVRYVMATSLNWIMNLGEYERFRGPDSWAPGILNEWWSMGFLLLGILNDDLWGMSIHGIQLPRICKGWYMGSMILGMSQSLLLDMFLEPVWCSNIETKTPWYSLGDSKCGMKFNGLSLVKILQNLRSWICVWMELDIRASVDGRLLSKIMMNVCGFSIFFPSYDGTVWPHHI